MSNAYAIQGISDEHTTCDCCGKSALKRTVCLRPADGSGDVFYGVNCAARALAVPGRWTTAMAGRLVTTVEARTKNAADRAALRERAQRMANEKRQPYAVIRSWGKLSGRGFWAVGPAGALRNDYLVREDAVETFAPMVTA